VAKPLLAAVLGIALASACCASAAQQAQRLYVGSSFGQSRAKFGDSVIAVSGAGSENVIQNQVENGYKAFAGWRFHRSAALEAGWVNFGKFHAQNSTSGPSGTAEFDSKRRGWNIDLVGYWQVAEEFSLLGRVGGLFSTSATRRTTTGGATLAPELAQPKSSELNFHWGFGVSWDFSRSMALRAEYEQAHNVGDAKTGEANLGLLSAGLVVKF
jgi:OmpA-OmpF porin, OOP family